MRRKRRHLLENIVGDRTAQRIYSAGKPVLLWMGRAWRRHLGRGTLVIGVTGSSGKTTTKDLIAGVLGSRFEGTAGISSSNRARGMLRVLATTRRRHRYTVHEVAAHGPGSLDELLWPLEPDVGVVLTVALEHLATFRTVESVGEEKAKLVRALPPHGLAILNADDPHVRAMAPLSRAPVVLIGQSPDATLRAENVRSAWPDRLTFDAVSGGERVHVRTQLLGVHWVTVALATLAVARHAGLTLADAAAALERQPTAENRCSEVRLANGVTILQDDWKAPLWSIELSLDVLRSAVTPGRRILVLGHLSDHKAEPRRVYRRVAESALTFADMVVAVGRWGSHILTAKGGEGRVHAFRTVRQAHEFLESELRAGDLVLVKATGWVDHIERLVLARTEEVRCWRVECGRQHWCWRCDLLLVPGEGSIGRRSGAMKGLLRAAQSRWSQVRP